MTLNTAQYQGRIFDLLVLRGAKPIGDVLLSQTVFGPDSSGEICTGAQMLAQRWALEFLTVTGSMTFLPDRGCDFMIAFYRGALRSELDVTQAFLAAEAQIRLNLRAEETDAMNPEERYDSAELLGVTISPEAVSLRVNIVSLAGNARVIILPISVLPIRTVA